MRFLKKNILANTETGRNNRWLEAEAAEAAQADTAAEAVPEEAEASEEEAEALGAEAVREEEVSEEAEAGPWAEDRVMSAGADRIILEYITDRVR